MKKQVIFFFGDSIFVGQGQSIYDGWVTKLSKYIECLNKNYLVVNSSINGRTTRQALEDMPYATNNLNIHSFIIQFGLNDCNHWDSDKGLPRVSEKSFEANILEIANRAKYAGAKNIIINNNHLTSVGVLKKYNVDYDFWSKKYNNILREIQNLDNLNIHFNDIELKIEKYLTKNKYHRKDILMPDGLHLNEIGHKIYFDLQKKFFKKLLKI